MRCQWKLLWHLLHVIPGTYQYLCGVQSTTTGVLTLKYGLYLEWTVLCPNDTLL
jgi:hypothetical protein